MAKWAVPHIGHLEAKPDKRLWRKGVDGGVFPCIFTKIRYGSTMIKPFNFLQRHTYGVLLNPLFFFGTGIGLLSRFFIVFFVLSGSLIARSLTPNTFGFWLALVVLFGCTARLLAWCWVAAFLSPQVKQSPRRIHVYEGVTRQFRAPLLFTLAFVVSMFAYRGKEHLLTGEAWIPFTLALAVVLETTLLFAGKFAAGKVNVLTYEEHSHIRYGGLYAAKVQHGQVPGAQANAAPPPLKQVALMTTPRFNFSAVLGMTDLKARLLEPGLAVVNRKAGQGDDPRNGILLLGDPGNGKTFIAEALAGELRVPLLTLDYGKVVSEWVGETSRNIARAFEQAKAAGPAVLFIDEGDSLLVSRDGPGSQGGEGEKIVNLMLTELVNIRRFPVLVVVATNRPGKMDVAALREGRFDFKIEVPAPDEVARLGLLKASLVKHVKGVPLDEEAVRSVAKRWEGFSVKRMMAVGEEMPSLLKDQPSDVVGYDQLMAALRRLQGRKGKVPADTKSLTELVLPRETREKVDLIANRLANSLRVESLGGSLPSGVLFYGPSGTGKTAVARALAKQTGWGFLAVAGPDLLRDPNAMTALYSEAKDIRPCFIFIDEADEVLRDRNFSHNAAVTNKLLTIMDGAEGKIKDIVFIAATNNPEQIDSAMLRGGRFTEKVEFFATDAQAAELVIQMWFAKSKARLAPSTSVPVVAKLLGGQSAANIESVLQYALNLAIDSHTVGQLEVDLVHVGKALNAVTPDI